MTYEKIVEKIKKAYSKVEATGINGHKAIQLNVRGEGEGALYIEAAGGKFNVQPYEYYDNDAVVTISSKVLLYIIDGIEEPSDAYSAVKLGIIGDVDLAIAILALRKVSVAKKTVKKAEDAARKAAKKAMPVADKAVKETKKAAKKAVEAAKPIADKAVEETKKAAKKAAENAKPMAEKAVNETKKTVKRAAATASKAIKAAADSIKEDQESNKVEKAATKAEKAALDAELAKAEESVKAATKKKEGKE